MSPWQQGPNAVPSEFTLKRDEALEMRGTLFSSLTSENNVFCDIFLKIKVESFSIVNRIVVSKYDTSASRVGHLKE